jgi:hypothetical protein
MTAQELIALLAKLPPDTIIHNYTFAYNLKETQ